MDSTGRGITGKDGPDRRYVGDRPGRNSPAPKIGKRQTVHGGGNRMTKELHGRRKDYAAAGRIDWRGQRLLGKFLATGVDDDRQMRIARCWHVQALLQPLLTRGRVEQVHAAYHRIDALRGIVDDDGELIRVLAVGAQQNEITDVAFEILCCFALNAICLLYTSRCV